MNVVLKFLVAGGARDRNYGRLLSFKLKPDKRSFMPEISIIPFLSTLLLSHFLKNTPI